MKIDDLLSTANLEPTMRINDIPYFNRPDAKKLLSACSFLKVGVLGIEGFVIDEGKVEPQMDWIADFSEIYKSSEYDSFVEKSLSGADVFLNLPDYRDDIVFEFLFKS